MSDTNLRRIIVAVIAMLLVYQMGVWLAVLWGAVGATLSTVIVAAVTFFCAYMARVGAGHVGWFLVPTLLFTLIPVAARAWNFFTEKRTWWERVVEHAPFLVGFLLPVLLLMVIYLELRRREAAAAKSSTSPEASTGPPSDLSPPGETK
jgi:hypothetical protein